jgi:GDP-D-mannose dehydratase
LTFKILDKLYNEKTKFYLFGTGELWNNCQGGVTIKTPFNYKNTPYVKSKHILTEKLNNYREKENRKNILLFHPFNFNTPYRTSGFLFAKIFDSLINRIKITTGDLNFSRDLVHPDFILKRVFESFEDDLIGSGHVTNIRDFINSLYKFFNMNKDDFLNEEILQASRHNNCFFHETSVEYNSLLEDTIKDINEFKHNKISI